MASSQQPVDELREQIEEMREEVEELEEEYGLDNDDAETVNELKQWQEILRHRL